MSGGRIDVLLENKVAVIYGAGGAIGSATARRFAAEGARVFLAGRTPASLEGVAAEIASAGGSADAAPVDALDEDDVRSHFDRIAMEAGRVDISFNAIGIDYVQGSSVVDQTAEEFTTPLAEVMRTQFLTTRAAGLHMREQRSGVILAITASPARLAIGNVGSFGPACAAIEGLCRQLAVELGPFDVRVVCLRSAGSPDAPGVDEVFDEHAAVAGITREEFDRNIRERTLLKRLPLLSEVADMAVLMASDRASAVTGAVANVTCGEVVD
jgi:3-oxoacyl-[acyl-carrier protein] reductase